MDRGEKLFWLLISIVGIWASVLVGLILNKDLASVYGQLVLVESTLIGIAAGGAVFVAYLNWPQRSHEVRPPETVLVASDPEKLRAFSPIHMMIMAIERVSPREASFGPYAGIGIGRFVRYDTPNLNFDEVRSVFSKYANVLGDHHLREWLKFSEEIKRYADRGGFWVGKRQWQWFDELEREYQDATKASPSEAPQLVTPQASVSQRQEIEVALEGVSDLPVEAIRFDMIVEVNEPIDAFGVKIGYGYGAPEKWANLDIREVTATGEIPAGQPVGIRAIARNDIIRFAVLTCWARDHRVSIRTVGREKLDFFTDIRFFSRFPEIYVQLLGVRSKMRRGYVMGFGGPVSDPVALIDIESELGKKMIDERERLAGRTPTDKKITAFAVRKEGWVEVFMTRQASTSIRQQVLVPF